MPGEFAYESRVAIKDRPDKNDMFIYSVDLFAQMRDGGLIWEGMWTEATLPSLCHTPNTGRRRIEFRGMKFDVPRAT